MLLAVLFFTIKLNKKTANREKSGAGTAGRRHFYR
jgi:hypothetical protein